MGVIIRQSIKGTVVNYIGVAIGFVTTFFVLTRCLTAEEIGLSRVLIDTAVMLAGLAQLGTNSSLMRFYPQFKDADKKDHGVFFWTIVIPFAGSLIFSLLFLVFKEPVCRSFTEKSPLFVKYYYALFPLSFALLYLAVFDTNANVLMRITVPKLIREVGIRSLLLVLYILYALDLFSIDGFVWGICLIYAAATLLNIIYVFSLKRVSLKPDFSLITKALRRDYLFYTLFLVSSSMVSVITPYVNTLFISAKMGLAFTGVFSIGVYVATLIEIPYRSLGAISQPQLSLALNNAQQEQTNRLCKDVSLHQFLAGAFIFFVIWINVDLLFEFLPNGETYVAAKWVILILGMNKLISSSLTIGASVLNYSRYYFWTLCINLFTTALTIVLNNRLIPVWGMNGAAAATLAVTLVYYLIILSLIHI